MQLTCRCGHLVAMTSTQTKQEIRCPQCETAWEVSHTPSDSFSSGKTSIMVEENASVMDPLATIPPARSDNDSVTMPPDDSASKKDDTLAQLADGKDTATLRPEQSDSKIINLLANVPGYELIEEVGRGGMGVVYKARQLQLNRIVALKMILSGAHAGSSDVIRFMSEAEAVATISHPHIVQVYEVNHHNQLPYMALEFVEGGTLSQKLKEGPISGKEAAQLVKQIALGMAAAHEAGVIHRDLKPDNILLNADGVPKITDFGLAKRVEGGSGITQTGAIMGTPSYMAPEQAGVTKDITSAVDVYGLGALLYELITGRPPFRAETHLDTLLQVVENPPAPPRLLNPKVDRDLETICLKCLEKSPANRYASAEALAQDLEHYLANEPIQARSVNWISRLSSELERSQYDVQFSAYGNMFYGFAIIVFLTELLVTWIILEKQSTTMLTATKITRIVLLGGVFWCFRPRMGVPTNAAMRIMTSIWLGYLITCYVIGITYRLVVQDAGAELELNLYPALAAVTGMAFFALGSTYWGKCYAIGVAYYVLAFFMVWKLEWAPISFGVLWAVVLYTIGWRLRHLGDRDK